MKTTEMRKALPTAITEKGIEYILSIYEDDGLWYAEYIDINSENTIIATAGETWDMVVDLIYKWAVRFGYVTEHTARREDFRIIELWYSAYQVTFIPGDKVLTRIFTSNMQAYELVEQVVTEAHVAQEVLDELASEMNEGGVELKHALIGEIRKNNILCEIRRDLRELIDTQSRDAADQYMAISAGKLYEKLSGRDYRDFQMGLYVERADVKENRDSYKKAAEGDPKIEALMGAFSETTYRCWDAWLAVLERFIEKMETYSDKEEAK